MILIWILTILTKKFQLILLWPTKVLILLTTWYFDNRMLTINFQGQMLDAELDLNLAQQMDDEVDIVMNADLDDQNDM